MLEKKPERHVPAKILNPPLVLTEGGWHPPASEPRQNSSGGITIDPILSIELLFPIVNKFLHVLCNSLYKIFPPLRFAEGGSAQYETL